MSAQRSPEASHDEREWGEVEQVLAALGELSQKVSSPLIRVCLESAREDIAHLTGTSAEGSDGQRA
jgi:hypothetical protein